MDILINNINENYEGFNIGLKIMAASLIISSSFLSIQYR